MLVRRSGSLRRRPGPLHGVPRHVVRAGPLRGLAAAGLPPRRRRGVRPAGCWAGGPPRPLVVQSLQRRHRGGHLLLHLLLLPSLLLIVSGLRRCVRLRRMRRLRKRQRRRRGEIQGEGQRRHVGPLVIRRTRAFGVRPRAAVSGTASVILRSRCRMVNLLEEITAGRGPQQRAWPHPASMVAPNVSSGGVVTFAL